ncbi:ATP-binding protein [Burkholderia sp. BCC1972]|uniref:ATP-binding protein n=1 Tax=Burkholderia sp. BCC1972 TaxID=2817438 RepID=UPI002ABD436A|nr:ATP-binding protein [Burkholderia sp. BCC1972]
MRNIVPVEPQSPKVLTFTVDSALLRELGERLVGKAHIALAELIKNSYDADASRCEITFHDDSIEIVDDGHGMTLDEFTRFWMRVGTTHKQHEEFSRELRRPLTGSKGVGRLAVQFLAHQVEIHSTAQGKRELLHVTVDWDKAVRREFLTQAQAEYEVTRTAASYAGGSPHGFRIVLSRLVQEWNEKSLSLLAREIWTLRPPFSGFAGKTGVDQSRDFTIDLHADAITGGAEAFQRQVSQGLSRWIAKIEGAIEKGYQTRSQRVTVTFEDGETISETFPLQDCDLNDATWEIRVFNLSGHLGGNVKVGDVRTYLSEFGGVHVYDGPFRLPYYGIHQDWLGLEFDHSHRKVKSRLLPSRFHVERALNDLPTQGRIIGVVRVDTGAEQRAANREERSNSEFLKIQVTRDRLQINNAYEQLRDAVRRSVDFYAVCSMRRRIEVAKRQRPSETPEEGASRVENALSNYRASMPAEVYDDLKHQVSSFVVATQREQTYRDAVTALLGPLATAGMAALALEHETGRQLSVLEGIASRLENAGGRAADFASDVMEWVHRFREMRKIFEPLSNAEDRERVAPLRAIRVIETVRASMSQFLEGVSVTVSGKRDVYLPMATLAEWHGVFQNVLTNALNAMVDSRRREIQIDIGTGPKQRSWVRISDSGKGIDLEKASEFFEPFKREGLISEQRQAMGLGGHGLGLTIVRMIAESRGAKVGFIEPEEGYASTFELSWVTSDDK